MLDAFFGAGVETAFGEAAAGAAPGSKGMRSSPLRRMAKIL